MPNPCLPIAIARASLVWLLGSFSNRSRVALVMYPLVSTTGMGSSARNRCSNVLRMIPIKAASLVDFRLRFLSLASVISPA